MLHINLRFKKTDADKDGHILVTIKEFEYVRDEL